MWDLILPNIGIVTMIVFFFSTSRFNFIAKITTPTHFAMVHNEHSPSQFCHLTNNTDADFVCIFEKIQWMLSAGPETLHWIENVKSHSTFHWQFVCVWRRFMFCGERGQIDDSSSHEMIKSQIGIRLCSYVIKVMWSHVACAVWYFDRDADKVQSNISDSVIFFHFILPANCRFDGNWN